MLTIIGTIKIDSDERRDFFLHNLTSMGSIRHLLRWRLNIVGRYADFANRRLNEEYDDVSLTHDNDTSTYELQRAQMDGLDGDAWVFLWQEDHWFVCPHYALFALLLDRFREFEADVLTVTHLTTSWTCKRHLPVIHDDRICTVYRVDLDGQERVWQHHPSAFLSGTPAIYSWSLANAILEFKREHMSNTTKPEFELDAKRGRQFLGAGQTFTEIIPKFHVFREVFASNRHPRSADLNDTLTWLKLRDTGPMFGGDELFYNRDHRDEAK
jgi:hypothetical protein